MITRAPLFRPKTCEIGRLACRRRHGPPSWRSARRSTSPSGSRKRGGRDLEHWLPEELQTFREVADNDPLAAAWRLTLCGLTCADVMGLRWSDVDLEESIVTVRAAERSSA